MRWLIRLANLIIIPIVIVQNVRESGLQLLPPHWMKCKFPAVNLRTQNHRRKCCPPTPPNTLLVFIFTPASNINWLVNGGDLFHLLPVVARLAPNNPSLCQRHYSTAISSFSKLRGAEGGEGGGGEGSGRWRSGEQISLFFCDNILICPGCVPWCMTGQQVELY